MAIELGTAAALLLRRLLPELCLAVGLAASSSAGARTSLIAAAYAVACYGGRMRYAVLVAGTGVYLVVQHLTGSADGIVQLCHRTSLDLVLPAVFGGLMRYQRVLNAALRERCARMADAMDDVTRFALLEERTRIAFDLHDHLGHQATCLALRAGALQQMPGLPAQARQAAEAVLEAARHMLGDLRTLLEAMREGKPQHNLLGSRTNSAEFLATLVRNMASTGMNVHCRVDGAPQLLSLPLEQLLHRACREAFTNIVKHAPGATVDVCLSYQQEQVTLAIRNGLSIGTAPVHSSGRMGLAGLGSRIAEAGGHLSAGPWPGGGFSFQLVLPTGADGEGKEQCVFA
ncbi:histidine kinase [Streptomyces sp. BA2]|uniref:histidine kinase n=1 Tax=Streptomyces sp. BA2 TaxID=436595 RepID=UPI00136DDCCC